MAGLLISGLFGLNRHWTCKDRGDPPHVGWLGVAIF